MLNAYIKEIEYYLPTKTLTNEDLQRDYPEWPISKIFKKTGINVRHISEENECASDLAFHACEKLFDQTSVKRSEIDFIILCTQSPDYFLPATACVLQNRLGLSVTCGAVDINQGCSGFIYGLGIAKGLVETGQSREVLLVTADTYSKYIHPSDKSVRTIFGDAAAVTLISSSSGDSGLERFSYGTDGSGAENLIVPAGAARAPISNESQEEYSDDSGNTRSSSNLYMDGAAIYEFSMTRVPEICLSLFDEEFTAEGVDFFLFHQANSFMLEALRRKMQISEDKFIQEFQHCGNTVSSSIPIALKEGLKSGYIQPGSCIAAVGFGVGYSWGSCIIKWR